MQIQQVIADIKAKGLKENYEKLVWAKKECMDKLEEAALNPQLAEGEVRDDSPIAKAVHRGSCKGKECSRAHCQPDLLALAQLPFGRGEAVVEQDLD